MRVATRDRDPHHNGNGHNGVVSLMVESTTIMAWQRVALGDSPTNKGSDG